jgi:hypothetical protein
MTPPGVCVALPQLALGIAAPADYVSRRHQRTRVGMSRGNLVDGTTQVHIRRRHRSSLVPLVGHCSIPQLSLRTSAPAAHRLGCGEHARVEATRRHLIHGLAHVYATRRHAARDPSDARICFVPQLAMRPVAEAVHPGIGRGHEA